MYDIIVGLPEKTNEIRPFVVDLELIEVADPELIEVAVDEPIIIVR